MINTTGKLASFCRFSLTTGSLPSDSLATDHWPLFFRPTPAPAPPAGSGRAQTLPRWLLPDTDRRIGKDRTGPDLHERPSTLSMSPNQATLAEKSIRFSSLAAAQPLNILSRPETLKASGSRRACRRPSAAMPVLSLISPSSPKQLGMVSPELPSSPKQLGMVSPELRCRRHLPRPPALRYHLSAWRLARYVPGLY